jgi:sulfate/thiosulfate-binding protein
MESRYLRSLVVAVFVFGVVSSLCNLLMAQQKRTLILGAYTVPKEAYQQEIIPAFQEYWNQKTGEVVEFQESYIASGAQARAIMGGFEADIAALSLEGDVQKLVHHGSITHDWQANSTRGFVTQSVVVIGYRTGNPKGIRDWEDLAKPGIQVLYPNPKTSGGAMWCVNAIYGGALKTTEAETGRPDPTYAEDLLYRIQKNVKVMDKSGRGSVTTYERGIGDAILTYENEALLRQMQGREFPYVVPRATILIENPIAVVDRNVDKHGTRDVAEAFVSFCLTEQAQRAYARYGLRPVIPSVAGEFSQKFPKPELLFNIDYLGGWSEVFQTIYGPDGIWMRVFQRIAAGK